METEILADIEKEGEIDPFDKLNQETKTPLESQTKKESEKKEPTQGDNTETAEDTAFHKRWEKRAENLKAELEAKHQEEIASLRQEFEAKIPKSKEVTEIPEWFKELYGENVTAWRKYEEREQAREAEIENRVIERQNAKIQEAQMQEQHWNKWVDDGIKKLSDEMGVDMVSLKDTGADGKPTNGLRNELIQTMLKYRPTDEQGNFDFKAGYEILKDLKSKEENPARSEARKRLADTTTKSSTSEKGSKDYMTSNELRQKSWNQI